MRRLSLLFAAALALLVGAPAEVAAAPAEWRCSYENPDGSVPATFPLNGCVQGGWITLHNDLEHPVRIVHSGDADPVVARTTGDAASTLTRLALGDDGIMLPSDVVRWPLGNGPVVLEVRGSRPALAVPIADALADVLPAGASRADLEPWAALVRDLSTSVDERTSCVRDENYLGRAACDVRTASAIAADVTEHLPEDDVAGVAALVLEPDRWREWAHRRTPGVRAAIRLDQGALEDVPTLPLGAQALAADGPASTPGGRVLLGGGSTPPAPVRPAPIRPAPIRPAPGPAQPPSPEPAPALDPAPAPAPAPKPPGAGPKPPGATPRPPAAPPADNGSPRDDDRDDDEDDRDDDRGDHRGHDRGDDRDDDHRDDDGKGNGKGRGKKD